MNAKAKKEAQAKVIERIDKELRAVQYEVRINKRTIKELVEKQKVQRVHECTFIQRNTGKILINNNYCNIIYDFTYNSF